MENKKELIGYKVKKDLKTAIKRALSDTEFVWPEYVLVGGHTELRRTGVSKGVAEYYRDCGEWGCKMKRQGGIFKMKITGVDRTFKEVSFKRISKKKYEEKSAMKVAAVIIYK